MSIITPTRNRADMLEYTLRSVLEQTYRDFEHIVIDGGSTDGTVALLRQYENVYPLRWWSADDNGMYQAVNRGLRKARGQILAYLNSDDVYLPWALEVVVEQFLRQPDADFCFGDCLAIEDYSGRTSLYFQPPFNADFVRRTGFLHQPAIFWRRHVFDEDGGFDETLRFVADCDYWMRASAHRTFSKVNEFLAVERDHASTIRQGEAKALGEELAQVRSRYVTLDGWKHRGQSAWQTIRVAIWTRVFWVAFAIQCAAPSPIRRRAWRRLIESGQPRIRWHLLPLRYVPGLSRGRPRVIEPSRFWLEQ